MRFDAFQSALRCEACGEGGIDASRVNSRPLDQVAGLKINDIESKAPIVCPLCGGDTWRLTVGKPHRQILWWNPLTWFNPKVVWTWLTVSS